MKLMKISVFVNSPPCEASVKQAIVDTIEGAYDSAPSEQIENSNKIIGFLIQLLVDNNVLTLEQIKPMLGYEYKLEDEA